MKAPVKNTGVFSFLKTLIHNLFFIRYLIKLNNLKLKLSVFGQPLI